MELFGMNFFNKREAPTPGVPTSTVEKEPDRVVGGDYQKRISYARSPEKALLVGTAYRAINLRADTMGIMPVQ